MSLQRDVQKIIILVMKYTNVSTRFHIITVENKIKHKNLIKINCVLIHLFFHEMRKTNIYFKSSEKFINIYFRFQNVQVFFLLTKASVFYMHMMYLFA